MLRQLAKHSDDTDRQDLAPPSRLSGIFRIRTSRLRAGGLLLFTALALTWFLYILFGTQLITELYNSKNFWLASAIMPGRRATPVEAYYLRADELLLQGTFLLIGLYLVILLVSKNPAGVLLALLSLLLTTFLLFFCLEIFPSLIKSLHLDNVSGYYAYKTSYIPDPELVFRERPHNRKTIHGLTPPHYSLAYGIEPSPIDIEWVMDENGFRNDHPTDRSDLIILGDSYLEYGETGADTFAARLERKLPGLTVRNLGKSGYAPFQYLETFKRFGLKYNPRYALMAFYEGNDLPETRDYLAWKSGNMSEIPGFLFKLGTESFLQRYWLAVSVTITEISKVVGGFQQPILQKIARLAGHGENVHPDVAIIRLGARVFRHVFLGRPETTTTDRIITSSEFRALTKVFADFRDISEKHGIKPIIIYIPTSTHIYARYSTEESGIKWRQVRAKQIAASGNIENAVARLAEQSHIDFISLTPIFLRAAEAGKMVYYPLDPHWNTEGTEIAADFVAAVLKSNYLDLPHRAASQPPPTDPYSSCASPWVSQFQPKSG